MRSVTGRRAASILYNLLSARSDRRPFLLPANICPVVPWTFLKAGFPFEFVDLDPVTWNLDLEEAGKRIKTGKIGGLLFAHTYGNPSTPASQFQKLKQLAGSFLLLDDRCLCFPDLIPDTGNPADAVLFSSGYAKMVDLGYGGYAFLGEEIPYHFQELPFSPNDLEQIEAASKNCLARRERFSYHQTNWLQMAPIPAWDEYSLALEQAMPASRNHREEVNAVYCSRLPAEIGFPESFQSWRFNIKVKKKDDILKAIQAGGLFASSHYASLAGIYASGDCPNAERLHAEVINLFNDHHYTVEMAEQTCDIIWKHI